MDSKPRVYRQWWYITKKPSQWKQSDIRTCSGLLEWKSSSLSSLNSTEGRTTLRWTFIGQNINSFNMITWEFLWALAKCFSANLRSLNKVFQRLQLDRSGFREEAGTLEGISSINSGRRSDIIIVSLHDIIIVSLAEKKALCLFLLSDLQKEEQNVLMVLSN